MTGRFSFDVFLSYSSKDQKIVRPLASHLQENNVRVWFDEWEIKPGDDVPARIEDGLERSRVLALCLSENALGTDWPALESQTFRFRDPLNKDCRFVPLRLDDAPLHDSLAQFACIDWRPQVRDSQFAQLLAVCRPAETGRVEDREDRGRFLEEKVVNLGYKESIEGMAFSPDGRRVLSGSDDRTLRLWEVDGGRKLRILKGHTHAVWSMAVSPDGKRVLSGSPDTTLWLWEVDSGRKLRILNGHTRAVTSVSFSSDGKLALSGSFDRTVRVWDLDSGRTLRVLEGHTEKVWCVAISSDGRRILSGSDDRTVRLWDLDSGRALRVLEGHTGGLTSVVFSPDGKLALSGADDKTVRLWEVDSGRTLRVLEGHTRWVWCVAFSSDGKLALSGSEDKTVRMWEVGSGRQLHLLEGHTDIVRSVAFSPDGKQVLSAAADGILRIWNLEKTEAAALATKTSKISGDQVQYTNAKALLVGDTGVGKSGLAERLVHGQFVPTQSSHARQTHVLESRMVEQPDGVVLHQETILWDLAGQPAYRSVHQLSMDDAALACVLFDARSETNPFEGASYWSQVLDQARTNTKLKLKKLLVASRIDVGGLPVSRERIDAFVKENGFERFIATSAITGEGCEELRDAIRQAIPWDEMPTITTTKMLAAIRDYVKKLKVQNSGSANGGKGAPPRLLFTVVALHEGFAADFGEKIGLDEFIVHLQRLEASDNVGLLIFSTTDAAPLPADLVLLDPTRVDAYSSAILTAAKDEPDGPGHLLESRVHNADFRLDKHERIADPKSERHLLWYVVEKLLARDLALRDRIKGQDYLIFPSQCTAELRFPGDANFGVTFNFAGPVRSIYARLIAHLAHYEGFERREFFQDAAAYRAEAGGRCLIHLRNQGGGQSELVVFYDTGTPSSVLQGFLEFVGKQLEAYSTPGSVARRLAYCCANKKCDKPFEDRVVKARLEARRKYLLCPFCEKKTPLLDLLAAPTVAAKRVAAQIVTDAQAGRQRMTAAFVIKAKEAEDKYDVFLSHNSKDKTTVERIAKKLKTVGLRPWFDKWDLAGGDTLMDVLEQAIQTIPCAALCFGPADVGTWHIMEIRGYVDQWAKKKARMVPVILPGVEKNPDLPLFVQQTIWVDMRQWEQDEGEAFYRLACAITGRAPGDSPMKKFGARHVYEWQSKRSK